MSKRFLAALGGVAVLAALAALWWGRAAPELEPWQPAAWLPESAEMVAWSEPTGDVAARFDELARSVAGLRGVWDAVQLATGVDWRSAEAVEKAGLRSDAGLAASWWHQAAWIAVPLAGPRGADHVLEQLRRRGYGVGAAEALGAGQLWRIASRDGVADKLQLWQGQAAVVLRLPQDGTPTGDSTSEFQAFLAAPRRASLDSRPGVLHLRWNWQADTAGATSGTAARVQAGLHQALGPADLLVGGMVERIQGLDADVQLGPQGLSAQVDLRSAPGKFADVAGYHAGFINDAAALSVSDLLPDETPLLAHLRLNPALWNSLPQVIQDAALPSHALQALHPSLSGVDARQALQAWDGQVAVALLAVADSVPLDPRAWEKLWWRTALRPVVAVSLKTDVQARELQDRLRQAIDTSADRSEAASFGEWTGFAVPGPGAPWLLLRRGRALAMVSGQGSADDLRRVAQGKYANLAKTAVGEQETAMVAGKNYWASALVHTPRVVRSLRRRGVPDYATQLLAAINSVAVSVELTADRFTVHLGMRPSPPDGEAAANAPVHGAAGAL